MKAKLANQDIGGAVAFFDRSSQDRYTEVFTALREQLPQMVQDMQTYSLFILRVALQNTGSEKMSSMAGR